MRAGYASEVYIVACGEILTLLQINNIARSIRKMNERGADCACAGIINNMRGVKNEERIVEEVAELMGVPVVIHIPRSQTVQEAEFLAQTVVQAYPDSDQALVYRDLAQRILMNEDVYVPNPIGLDEIKPIIQKYS
jgi:nitrogenase iron protein NifH